MSCSKQAPGVYVRSNGTAMLVPKKVAGLSVLPDGTVAITATALRRLARLAASSGGPR